MAEEKNYFTTEMQAKALEWLGKKWVMQRNCEVCGTNKWELAKDLVMPMPFVGGGLVVGGSSYPQVMIVCSSCCHTKYFNAVAMGVVTTEKAGKKQKA